MKNKNYEFIQRIESHYVGDNCIQIMISNYPNSTITILNSDGMTYHYKPSSSLFINQYLSDKRKEQFPYHQIPNHTSRVGLRKMECINQLFDFNRVYISITNGLVREDYVIKDDDEALLATKYIFPTEKTTKYMNRNEVIELLKKANGGIFSLDGGTFDDYSRLMPSEERIIEWYKEQLIKKRKEETTMHSDKELTEYFYKSLDKLTIADVPINTTVFANLILISIENNEIQSIKATTVKFFGSNHYQVESYNLPITIYSLEHLKKLEYTNSREVSEPKFPAFLNKTVNKTVINKAKQLILERKK